MSQIQKPVDYKAKWKKTQNKLNKMKPYADTMARHNNRLQNENNSLNYALKRAHALIEELCPHKFDWLDEKRQTQWGEQIMYYCEKCNHYIELEQIDRTI